MKHPDGAIIADASTDPASTDPASTDPASTDPASADPASTDPACTDPALRMRACPPIAAAGAIAQEPAVSRPAQESTHAARQRSRPAV